MKKRLVLSATLLLLLTMILPISTSTVKAQSNNTNVDDNDLTTKLTITYPNDSTFYVNTMPLVFTIDWNCDASVPWMNMQISYSIDDNQKIQTNGGGYLVFTSPVLTTYTNSVVDISNLAGGIHKLSIFVDGIYNVDDDFIFVYNSSFSPTYFSVNYLPTTPTPAPTAMPTPTPTSSPSPSPTPTVPEFSWMVAILTVIVGVSISSAVTMLRRSRQGSHEI